MESLPIVVIPVSYDGAPCLFAGQVALRTDRRLFAQMDVANALIGRNQVANGVGAIVNDDQLFVGIFLAQEVGNSLYDKCAAVICGHDTTYQRLIFTSYMGGGGGQC